MVGEISVTDNVAPNLETDLPALLNPQIQRRMFSLGFPVSLIKPGKSNPTGKRLAFEILVISVPDHSESGLAFSNEGANNETPPVVIYIGSRPCADTVG